MIPTLPVPSTSAMLFFNFDAYWGAYLCFAAFVVFLLSLDLGVFHRKAHVVGVREATMWSLIWIALALCFNFLLYQYTYAKVESSPELQALWGPADVVAKRFGLEFLTGYIIEKALSVDNIFVFIVMFQFFSIKEEYQHRILFFGILGALIFRAIFIALGSFVMHLHFVAIALGVLLIYSGFKLFFAGDKPLEPGKNPLLRWFHRYFPVSQEFDGQRFFTHIAGKLHATPLFVALIFVEITDIVFAFDSVPAIFAITKEPFIVFTSNVFAILGLRALYFLLAAVMHLFHYLKYGLGVVLIFVGMKLSLLDMLFGGKFPVGWSLGIIAAAIGAAIGLSLLFPQKEETAST